MTKDLSAVPSTSGPPKEDPAVSDVSSKAAAKDVESIIPAAVTGAAAEQPAGVPDKVPLLPEGTKNVPPPAPPPALTTDLPTTEPVGGPSAPLVATEASPVAESVRMLVGAARHAVPLSLGANLQYRATLAWRYDRSVVQAILARDEVQRYPVLPVMGIYRYAYGYADQANPDRIIPHNSYDLDWRWRAKYEDTLPRHPLTLQPNIQKAITESTDDIAAFTVVTRARGWYFEGKTFLSLGTIFKNRQVERGYSTMAPILKLMGYQLSLVAPADDGLLGCASIDAASAGQWGPNWFPGHPASGAGLQPCYGSLISLIKFRDWMTGQQQLNVGVPGALEPITPAMIGTRVTIVPLPLAYIQCAAIVVWYWISKLYYPLKNRFREGPVRDWEGDLLHQDNAGNWVPWNNQWYPISSLTSIEGSVIPTAANQPPTAVLFVLFEEYPQDGAITLTLPTAAAPVNLVLGGAFQDVSPVLDHRFQQGVATELPAISDALSILFSYEAGSIDLADCVRFWQCQGNVLPTLSEGSDNDWESIIGPEGADHRGWVDGYHLLVSTARNRRAPPYVPTNMVAAWPGVAFLDANPPVAATSSYHWDIPIHDQVIALGVVTRILAPTETPPREVDPPQPELLLPWVMVGGHQLGVATDLLLTSNGVSRAMLYYVARGMPPAHTVSTMSDQQDMVWGRPGKPGAEGAAGMGPAISSMLFGSRVLAWHPCNGIVQAMPQAQVPNAYIGGHTVILGRYDTPTLAQFSSAVTVSTDESTDLTDLTYTPVLRDGNRVIKDLYTRLPDPSLSDSWTKAWDIPRRALDGLMANREGLGRYRTLRINKLDAPNQMAQLPGTVSGPLTWGSLLAYPGDPSATIAFSPEPWTLTFQRPVGPYDPTDATDLGLVVRDRTWAYTKDVYARFKPGYYLSPLGTKWATYAADSKSYVRRRRFVVPTV
ncbi:hypothetical protein 4 [Wenzhou crab virus 5]|uniref:hypothetical protein 4 n=1 Tax=Wenzhou crab virus 5 TaxID=1923562 RepID=UPI00090A7CE5|nr:hypothetical protein 4 [Wenzhou crab virus 5]APG76068.1 hypothetical protein 4 [Wenzhou crab virus 5]